MSDQTISLRINERQRELLDGAERMSYKELADGDSLDLYVYSPPGAASRLPVIVFFYGGGFWERGEVSQNPPP